MIGIVDSDILVYRCGFAAEKKHKIQREDGDIEHVKEVEPLANALHNIDTVVDSIAGKFDSLEFYLSGTGNWRLEEATVKPYKGNRSPFNKPVYYKEIREYSCTVGVLATMQIKVPSDCSGFLSSLRVAFAP